MHFSVFLETATHASLNQVLVSLLKDPQQSDTKVNTDMNTFDAQKLEKCHAVPMK